MPVPSVGPDRSPAAIAFLPAALLALLSTCSDNIPVSPTDEATRVTPVAQNAVRGKIAIKVARRVTLLKNGNVEVGVRAVCPRGLCEGGVGAALSGAGARQRGTVGSAR